MCHYEYPNTFTVIVSGNVDVCASSVYQALLREREGLGTRLAHTHDVTLV